MRRKPWLYPLLYERACGKGLCEGKELQKRTEQASLCLYDNAVRHKSQKRTHSRVFAAQAGRISGATKRDRVAGGGAGAVMALWVSFRKKRYGMQSHLRDNGVTRAV